MPGRRSVERPPHAAHGHQRSRDQERAGRNLCDEQHVAKRQPPACRVGQSVLDHLQRTARPRLPCRDHPDQQRAAHGQRQTREVNARIQVQVQTLVAGAQRCRPPVQRGQQHARARQPRGAPDERDQQRLRQQLPDQPQPARAQGHAQRQLPAAIRRARGKGAGQVHADRRQQQERQHVHAVEKSANALTVVSHQTRADQSHPYGLVRLRILLRQLGRDRVQICRRLLRRHARLEPADHQDRAPVPALQVLRPPEVVDDGYPVVRPREPLRSVERRRGHADHRERLLVQPHRRPDDARIATEHASPQGVAQYDIRRRIQAPLVRRVEEPSDLGLHPQHVEVVAGDGDAAELRPRVTPAEARFRVRPEPDHVAEGWCFAGEDPGRRDTTSSGCFRSSAARTGSDTGSGGRSPRRGAARPC